MKNTRYFIYTVIGLISIFILGCQPNSKLTQGEGFIDVTGGKVWYKIVGEGDNTPLLLLHGGPGFTSYYLNPMADLAKDRPVIFFDQLGCGRSDREIDTTLMTVEAYVEQVEQLRKTLGLKEFYLYGHSWGTMLGIDYYLSYPDHVKAMIFASPALSVSKWSKDADVLVSTLPDSIQTDIKTSVENNTFDTPSYEHAITVFYQRYVARKLPWDANMDSTFAGANLNVYNYMWGPSEFTATGTLKNYERADKLPEIKVPTLYVCGEYDEARPETVQYFQSLTPGSKMAVIEDAAHVTMHDNPEQNNMVIEGFLKGLKE
ncbi:proline iminopeptidase-family hydrolase [Lutimonas zeaxanthinifaciens]|uniref:proline iminopeptidase-family hydrolase n=1 Tax=Lutimonas zeaxanthinifaciens TaxID=3060215 RepID=UPI00265D32DC|nr:proline iminopeptidase-family hydrolase [Lutimonas sp. YSD2104]WKK67515.1 proline iminopeptidase-family hydrolase [Lutimonas sp. YSD2104]